MLMTGCAQFEKNMKEDQDATSIKSLSEKQSAQVDQLEEAGQINAYEAEQMQEAIHGTRQ